MTAHPHQRGSLATPTTHVTAHTLYASAALQGMLANPNLITDYDKTSRAAEKWADAMVMRDSEMERGR